MPQDMETFLEKYNPELIDAIKLFMKHHRNYDACDSFDYLDSDGYDQYLNLGLYENEN